jgi:sporulation protein YlmC with PRC-barrel domain
MATAKFLATVLLMGLSTVALAESPASSNKTATEARQLVGKSVQTPAGEKLGTVKDVMLDESQNSEYAIITYGEQRFAAVPLDRVRSMIQKDTVVLDRAQLEGAPVLKDQEWRKTGSQDWSRSADRYWERGSNMRSASPTTTPEPRR